MALYEWTIGKGMNGVGYALFLLLNLLPAVTVWMVLPRVTRSSSLAVQALTAATLYAVLVHLVLIVTGLCGMLAVPTLLFVHLLLAALAVRFRGERSFPPRSLERIAPLPLWPFAFWIVCGMLAIGLALPPHRPDSLIYHLPFPVTWLEAKRLVMTFTPFGGVEPPYAPLHGDLWTLWWLLPLRGDEMAKVSQFPFFLLAGLALYRLVRQGGGSRRSGVLAALLFWTTPAVVQQGASPYVDVTFAAWIFVHASALIDLHQALERGDSIREASWLAALSLGEILGTKYSALLFLPLLFLPLLLILLNHRVLPEGAGNLRQEIVGRIRRLLGVVAFLLLVGLVVGGFTYLRNLVLTGDIVYPAHLEIFGHRWMRGAYGRAEMLAYQHHLDRPAYVVYLLASAFGARRLLLVGLLFFAFFRRLLRSDRGSWPFFYFEFLFPLLYLFLHFYGSPFNSQHRFLFPAVGFAYVAMAPLIDLPRFGVLFEGFVTLVVLWELLLPLPETRIAIFQFSALPLVRNVGLCLGVCLLLFLLALRRYRGAGGGRGGVVPALAHLLVAVALLAATHAGRLYPVSVRVYRHEGYIAGWVWVGRNLRHTRIAYTGHNYPYYLFGPGYTNDVRYVHTNRHRDWLFHDFDLAARQDPRYQGVGSVVPVNYRKETDFEAWLENLTFFGIEYLVTYPLDPIDTESWRDAEGFPIEDAWARAHPTHFTPLFAEGSVRIYRFHRNEP